MEQTANELKITTALWHRNSSMKVEIWSDIACPWCYIGKRRFESALERFAHRDEVEVSWRSFQLDPTAPTSSDQTMDVVLSRKYGIPLSQAAAMNAKLEALAAEIGLEYHLSTIRYTNTLAAHRLLHLASHHRRQDAMKERLMHAYFTENLPLGDTDTLVGLAHEVGLDPAEVRRVLESDTYADEVRDDLRRASLLGIRGVPFFVLDEAFGVSGAQPVEIFLQALEQAWAESHPLQTVTSTEDGTTCEGDACAVTPAGVQSS
jgi:predicted DsbA family dithiol-disulfide isomerase